MPSDDKPYQTICLSRIMSADTITNGERVILTVRLSWCYTCRIPFLYRRYWCLLVDPYNFFCFCKIWVNICKKKKLCHLTDSIKLCLRKSRWRTWSGLKDLILFIYLYRYSMLEILSVWENQDKELIMPEHFKTAIDGWHNKLNGSHDTIPTRTSWSPL